MITGKNKKEYKYMEGQIANLKWENNKLKNELEKLQHNKEINTELVNIVKAILFQFSNHQIEIDEKDIREAERGDIYIETSYMKFARIVKLIFKDNKLNCE